MSSITINCDNVVGQISGQLSHEQLTYIDSKTRYRPKGYDKTWRFQNGRWDGWAHTFNPSDKAFRIGLLGRVIGALEHLGFQPTVQRSSPGHSSLVTSANMPEGMLKPLDYQAKVRQVVRDHDIGIIASPTGSGKSAMMALAIEELGTRTLLLTNDLVLTDQMHRNLQRYFPQASVGYIGNSEFELGDIVVSTVQSFASILGLTKGKVKKDDSRNHDLRSWLRGVGLVLHDEVHLADSETCIAVYDQLSYTPKRFGFSATAMEWAEKSTKVSNVELEQVFGKVIYSTFGTDFIALGMKVPLFVRSIEVPYRMKVYGTHRDNQAQLYKQCLQYEILQNDAWLEAIVNITKEYTDAGHTAFVYAAHSIEYGNRVAKALDAPFVNGKTKRKERFRLFDAVQSKQLPCLVSDIGGVGLDIPSLDAFILASDAKDIRQMSGRVERSSAATGKEYGHFVDMFKGCSFLAKHREIREHQYTANNAIVI